MPPKTTKGDATRAAILEQGLAMASEVGLEGLSIGGLAKATGMSKSGLFAHFASKENLQAAVIEAAVERFRDTVVVPSVEAARGAPRLQAFFENWLEWGHDPSLPGGCLFIAAANELDDRPGPVRDLLIHYQRLWLGQLSTAARIAVEAGHFRADLDSEQFAYDFYAIILGYHHFFRLLRDDDAKGRARQSFERLMRSAAIPTV